MRNLRLKIGIGLSGLFLLLFAMVIFYNWKKATPVVMTYGVAEDFTPGTIANQEFSARIPAVDIIAFAFLKVSTAGEVFPPAPQFPAFLRFSKYSLPSVKKLFSVGGADDQAAFFNALQHQDRFIETVNHTLATFHLAGIDLDFELMRPFTPEEANQYTQLISKLRQKIGVDKIITLTTVVDPQTIQSLGENNWQAVAKAGNYISVMCYDMASPFFKPYFTQLSSNLYTNPKAPPSLTNHNLSCHQAIQQLMFLGVPAQQILLGVPAYGVAFGGASALNQPSLPEKTPIFDDMGKGLFRYSTWPALKRQGFVPMQTMNGQVINGVWAYHWARQEFITLETPASLQVKIQYVHENQLGGAMMWRMGQDLPLQDGQALLRVLQQVKK